MPPQSKITERFYWRASGDVQTWLDMLQTKHNIAKNKVMRKAKKTDFVLSAETYTEWDKTGNVRKSTRRIFNSQEADTLLFHNQYDQHCRIAESTWEYENSQASSQIVSTLSLVPQKQSYTYNENGDVETLIADDVKYEFAYTYNNYGDWTECLISANKDLLWLLVREIEYASGVKTIAESEEKLGLAENSAEEQGLEEIEEPDDDQIEEVPEEESNSDETKISEQEPYSKPDVPLEEESAEELNEEHEGQFSNSLVGRKVIHTKFGIGIIQNEDGKYLYISFAGAVKKFLPDAFERGYLTLI